MKHLYAVVGAGLVGSALTRRLAEAGHRVVCFGPGHGKPPFSSHDDSGRITRVLDGSDLWATLAARAIAGYSDIEARSGVRFHHPVGVLWSAGSERPLEPLRAVGRAFGVDHRAGLGGWEGVIGPSGDPSLLERSPAGYVAPREMLRAHRTLAMSAGASFDPRVVVAVDSNAGRCSVTLSDGETALFDRVAVAAGAGTRELLGLDLSVSGEVVIDAAVPDDVGERLAGRPCIGRLSSDGAVVEGYLTPPIRGGDGWAIKFGAEVGASPDLDDSESIVEWMTGTEHRIRLPAMSQALSDLLPPIVFGRIRSRPCVYTRTPTGLPIVDEVADGVVAVTGGNGRMAKSADAVAGLAAALVSSGSWDDELAPDLFATP